MDAPADAAFAFATDITRWPLWFTPVVCAQHPESLPLAVNEELLLCLHAGRRRWQERFEVTRLVRNAFISLEGAFSAARRIDFRFEQRGRQTRVACAMGYPVFGGAIARFFDSLFRKRRVQSEVSDSLHRLKALVEERLHVSPLEDDIPGAALPMPAFLSPAEELEVPIAAH
ncbi:MAG TPA: SRPBCC family protein [Candidatus Eremiobacteraceae bacterium]|nr:SRPBCC family protein [Candidatus Eremiobacteraceae bacterium]